MNKIKEIQDELFLKRYPFINSDSLDVMKNLVYNHSKHIADKLSPLRFIEVYFCYILNVVKEEILFNKIYTKEEILDIILKAETIMQKEGRVKCNHDVTYIGNLYATTRHTFSREENTYIFTMSWKIK